MKTRKNFKRLSIQEMSEVKGGIWIPEEEHTFCSDMVYFVAMNDAYQISINHGAHPDDRSQAGALYLDLVRACN